MNNNCGVYQIRNIENGHIYIGQSSNLKNRYYKHFYDLKRNIHENSHLQRAYNKYGESSFLFEILIFCDEKSLNHYEQSILDNSKNIYNIHKESVMNARGVKRSDETKIKIGLRSLGNKNRLGKKHSPESINKMKQSKLGHTHSEETKAKMSKSRIGHPSYSDKLKGIPRSKEIKRKISLKNKGHPVSDKQRKQISEYWAKRRLEKLNGKKN